MNKRLSSRRHARPLTDRECVILDRIGRDRTHKDIASELGVSINTVANLAANAHRKLGAHGAAAAVLAHRDAHPWCGTRIDFGPPALPCLSHAVARSNLEGHRTPHRAAADGPSWDKVRLLRKTIAEMQAELNRMLDALEPD